MERTLLAFDQHADGAVGQFQQLQHGRDDAQIIELIANRIVFRRIELCHQEDFLVGIHRLFKRDDRFVATDKQRHDHIRKNHDVAQRQQRQRLGFGGGTGFKLGHFNSNMLHCNSASIHYMVAARDTSSVMRPISEAA